MKVDFAHFKISDYLGREFDCSCGRKHKVGTEKIIIENRALYRVPEVLSSFRYQNVLLVTDKNCYQAAGKDVERLIKDAGLGYQVMIYQRTDDLVPDERAIGELLVKIHQEIDVIVAVGSGVLNDLTKYVGSKLNIPSVIVATAPSMDGYVSDTSALILNNLKTSVNVNTPRAIIADVDVLKKAPLEMIRAGLGDMLGKYSALKDWKLAKIITGEYYCEPVTKMIDYSVHKCIDQIEGYNKRDDTAIKNLMEGLVISGIAMSFIGNSRPASGSEHHISHFWEMMFLESGKKAVLHGTKVGIGAIAVHQISSILSRKKIDFASLPAKAALFDEQKWQEDVIRLFKRAAPSIIKQTQKNDRNSLTARLQRIELIQHNWDRIMEVLAGKPTTVEIKDLLTTVGAPTNPQVLGIQSDLVYYSIIYAKEIRVRYTILQLIWDLGLLEEIAAEIKEYFAD